MRRYWVDTQALEGEIVFFDGETWHHIFEVCRQEQGSKFEVLCGDGFAYFVELVSTTRKNGKGKILEKRSLPPSKPPSIHLCISVPRLPKMDFILEKCVELGISSVKPFVSEFSFLRQIKDLSPSRQERWKKIVQGATRQSGRGELMGVETAVTLETLLNKMNRKTGVQGLFLYESAEGLSLKAALNNVSNTQEVWAYIGSEGGFSHQEVNLFDQFGLPPIGLGPQVLRVETACVTLASILKYEFGQLE